MRTGVVLELKDGRAVVLDGSGGFREVSARTEWRAGDVVSLPGARTRPGRWAGLAACLVLDAFAFLLPGVVATITAMHVIRKDKNKFRKPMPKR